MVNNSSIVTRTAFPVVSNIDLHIHTFHSDGRDSPADVLRYAAELNLTTIAITDHDNTNGAREVMLPAKEQGLELIPAIEFTSRWGECDLTQGDRDVDVLGYWIDLNDPSFQAFERAALDDVHARIDECCTRLSADGYPITIQDLFAENPRYAGLTQLIHALQHKGYAQGWSQAAPMAFSHWWQVRQGRFTVEETIAQIHRAGGIAILAHPSAIRCKGHQSGTGWPGIEQMAQLVDAGLDGLEIYHFRLDEQARTHFLSMVEHFGLLSSGGSDEHGWGEGYKRLGTQPVTIEMVRAMYARHMEWSKRGR